MPTFSKDSLFAAARNPLLGATQSRGYGTMEKADSQQPQRGNFRGTSFREADSSKSPPFLLKLLENPVEMALSIGSTIHNVLQIAMEHPAFNHHSLANQLKEELKPLHSHPFAERCSHVRRDKTSKVTSARAKAQEILYYQKAKAASDTIIDQLIDEAAKYQMIAGKTGRLESAFRTFQSKDIARLGISQALGSYHKAFEKFNESAFEHQSSETSGNAQAISTAIYEGI